MKNTTLVVRIHRYLATTLLILSCGLPAFAQSVQEVPFARANVLAFQLTSDFIEPDILVEVALPLSYQPGNPDQSYPVMYLVDGLVHFPMLASNNILLSFGDAEFVPPIIPEVITVGIDFAVPLDQRDLQRLIYYTPTETIDEDFGLIGGKADHFLDFINQELKPFINATFDTDTDQELFAGHSLGGLFSLYTLFTQPDTFEKFIAASPSIYWDNEVIYRFEREYLRQRPHTRESLFMSVGSIEDPWGITLDYVTRMARQIKRREYRKLDFHMKVFSGETHSSVVVRAYARGARFVFRDH